MKQFLPNQRYIFLDAIMCVEDEPGLDPESKRNNLQIFCEWHTEKWRDYKNEPEKYIMADYHYKKMGNNWNCDTKKVAAEEYVYTTHSKYWQNCCLCQYHPCLINAHRWTPVCKLPLVQGGNSNACSIRLLQKPP